MRDKQEELISERKEITKLMISHKQWENYVKNLGEEVKKIQKENSKIVIKEVSLQEIQDDLEKSR